MNLRKILIIRFSSIGDIVLTTPVVRCIKQQLGVEVHFLTKQFFGQILTPNPYIDKVYTIQKKVAEVLPQLQAEQYDYIIDLHNNLRSLQVKRALRVKSTAFRKLNFAKWLIVNLKINRLPDTHIVDRYLATTTTLGVQNDALGLDYFIPDDQQVDIAQLLAPLQLPERVAAPYIAFAIGAAHATKRLPQHKIIEICTQLSLPVVLLGGKAETAVGDAIAQAAGKHVLNTCGKLSLHQSASVVQQAYKVISHDTGMMHIAAALHKPILSVWGNTIPEFGMYPYYGAQADQETRIEVQDLGCRPCSKIGHQVCPKGHFKCMELIDVDQIVGVST